MITAKAQIQDTEAAVNVKIASLKGPTSIGMLKLHKENPSLGNNVKLKL